MNPNNKEQVEIHHPCRTSAQLLIAIKDGSTDETLEKIFTILKNKENQLFSSYNDMEAFKSALLEAENKEKLWQKLERVFFSDEKNIIKSITKEVVSGVVDILGLSDEQLIDKRKQELEEYAKSAGEVLKRNPGSTFDVMALKNNEEMKAYLESLKEDAEQLTEILLSDIENPFILSTIIHILGDRVFPILTKIAEELDCYDIFWISDRCKDQPDQLFKWLTLDTVIDKVYGGAIVEISEIFTDHPTLLFQWLHLENVIAKLNGSNIVNISKILQGNPIQLFEWLKGNDVIEKLNGSNIVQISEIFTDHPKLLFQWLHLENVIAKLNWSNIVNISKTLQGNPIQLFEWLKGNDVIEKLNGSNIVQISEILKDHPGKLFEWLKLENVIEKLDRGTIKYFNEIFKDVLIIKIGFLRRNKAILKK